MRIKGQKIEGLNVEEIFIPRGEETIVFRARAVADYTIHDAINPRPKARRGKNRAGELVEMVNDKSYNEQLDAWGSRRVAYMVIKSLEATEELEWETVNIEDMNTWNNWRKELEDSGFTEPEVNRIFGGILSACGLDESKVEKARARFLAGRRAESEELSFQKDEQNSTESGELVSDSE